jgi:hypothetical protein
MVKISISIILGRICVDSVILSEWFGFHYRLRFGLSFEFDCDDDGCVRELWLLVLVVLVAAVV